MSIIILGYMFGIIHKILYDFNWVIWVYVIDACLVLVDLSLYCYYKNKKV